MTPEPSTLRSDLAGGASGLGRGGLSAVEDGSGGPCEVAGRIEGPFPEGTRIVAVLTTLEGGSLREQIAAEGALEATGWFELRYGSPAADGRARDASLTVRLHGPDGRPIAQSRPLLSPPRRLRLVLSIPSAQEAPELVLLERRISDRLDGGLAALDGLDAAARAEVARWIEVEADRLDALSAARRLASETGLPEALFYALARAGLPEALDTLVDVPLRDLRTAVVEAAAANVVGPEVVEGLDEHLALLAGRIVDAAMAAGGDAPAGLADVLAAASLPEPAVRDVLHRYLARSGTEVEFWEEAGEAEAAEDAAEGVSAAEAVRLAGMVGDDPALLRDLWQRRTQGRWRRLEDLAGWSVEEWCGVLEALGDGAAEVEDGPSVTDRARAIVEAVAEAFPSERIRRTLAARGDLSPAAQRVLAEVGSHDFLGSSIRARLGERAQAVGEAAEAIDEIEAVERVSRVTAQADEVASLLGGGMRSALDIASTPRRQFIGLFAEALGGRRQAARIHAQARHRAAAAKLSFVRLVQARQGMPLVLGGSPSLKDIPDLRTLFGSVGFCGCDDCGSVYSPAAYLVDLLRYLDLQHPARTEEARKRLARRGVTRAPVAPAGQGPLDVLLERRPDLARVRLTCENTKTPLPYIDLVNELLEAHVAEQDATHDTGQVPADVLRAVPQHLTPLAYRRLQEAVHPAGLPYHQPLGVVRAYLGHLGVSRLELMRALGNHPADRAALLAEALGMSPEELDAVARPPAELWRHVGSAGPESGGASYVKELAAAPRLLDALGITFQELIDLVRAPFVSAGGALSLETPVPDGDPEKVAVAGLDEARLSRMVRFLRLKRRLGLGIAELDRALRALSATELDLDALERLATARELARQLDRPLPELLVLWAPIDTRGASSEFDRLFGARAVAWRTGDKAVFQLRDDGSELVRTGGALEAVAPALLAAFRVTSGELLRVISALARRGAPPRLDLAGLSSLYRVVVLARALDLRLEDLDALLRLVPPEADPLRGDPAATQRFVEVARRVQGSELTPAKLAYLFRHEVEPGRDPGPSAAQLQAIVGAVRGGLLDAEAETGPADDATGEVLQQRLGMLLDPELLGPAVEVLDPRRPVTVEERRRFFDQHLARIFPDPAAVAARLFEAGPRPATGRPGEGAGPGAPPPAAVSPEELHWKENVQLVLAHLLPLLRARRTRGAVVQVLSDNLGLSAASTALLLEQALRSRRRPGAPAMDDFLALLGTGLTGAYFAGGELEGAPAAVRVDPELSFAWAGAPPAPGIPGRGFSARWTGSYVPRAAGRHVFHVRTDGAVRIAVKRGGAEQVLLDRAAAGARVQEHASDPVALEPGVPCELRIEYRNRGAPAQLGIEVGTAPSSKRPLPGADLLPEDGLSSFAPVEATYRRLHKAAMLIGGLGVSDAVLAWLTAAPAYLDLDALPISPGEASGAAAQFARWLVLADVLALRKRLGRIPGELTDALRAGTLAEATARLAAATGWEPAAVNAFAGPGGLGLDPAGGLRLPGTPILGESPGVLRLARAIELQRRAGVAPATLLSWARDPPDEDMAAAVVQAVKARYDERRWLEVAQALNDPLRIERRDALVAYLLPRMRALGVKRRDQLFEHFLIDVDMNPCMLTSRIRQAISAVQTFYQRCLMNLEPRVPHRALSAGDYKWLKSYRVWEANRKVFLYPENWIEPELRDDKSPLFQELEGAILQQEIKDENVEAAFAGYLSGLHEIARLDVRAAWFERGDGTVEPASTAPESPWDHGTYHVLARTHSPPHVWYTRRLVHGRSWTPWEKVDADVDGDHAVPVVFQRRLHLFWTTFREVSRELPKLKRSSEGEAPNVGKDWEVHLAYSVLDRGRWSRTRLSSEGLRDGSAGSSFERGSRDVFPQPSAYTIGPAVNEATGFVDLVVLRRAAQWRLAPAKVPPPDAVVLGSFRMDGASGELSVRRLQPQERSRSTRRLAAPAGYAVDGMAFALEAGGGSLLSLAAGRGAPRVALGASPRDRQKSRFLPVAGDAAAPSELRPFFFQDPAHGYFARPTPASGPLRVWWRGRAARIGRHEVFRFGRSLLRTSPRRGSAPGREEEEGEGATLLPPEALDAREDQLDDLWHPDDAAEALAAPPKHQPPPRPAPAWSATASAIKSPARPVVPPPPPPRRTPPPAPAPRLRPRSVRLPPPAPPREKLRFIAFDHPATLSLLRTLKARGLDGLFAFGTARPEHGRDHDLVALPASGDHGARLEWRLRRPTVFERTYRPGPLVDVSRPPHLDVDFDWDNPYALYNWELFFHAPFQVAIRLSRDGRHEEAQRWFHFIFDPLSDSSAPAPARYWRFPPFHAGTERTAAGELMALLAYDGKDPDLRERRQRVVDQVAAWVEKPFSPHAIARLRVVAYQKAVVMKYLDNLVEWGDKLFARDSAESIQEATQLYVLAGNILGPRPERIPPIVEPKPVTFAELRGRLDPFANLEVAIENSQVRSPFRIAPHRDQDAATSILGMATLYFCIPPNPEMERRWDTVADRLFKIRNCMNLQGVVRQLPLFEPPIDPALLVRAQAAGVDLGSVVASLRAPPPHHRFRFLLDRALRLVEELRGFSATALQALERQDAEGLAALRAASETALLAALREVRQRRVKQVEEELAQLSLEREHLDLQSQHAAAEIQQLMNPQEDSRHKSLTAGQTAASLAEGIELASKVVYAIPELQTGAAGAFSSPFLTLQLGGQSMGDVLAAVAKGLEKVRSRVGTEAEMAGIQGHYQHRRTARQQDTELLAKQKARLDKRVAEVQIKLEIVGAELRQHDLAVESARKTEAYLREKYTSRELYGWMLGQLSGLSFQAYKAAFEAAQQAERAFRFERAEPSASFIEFSYWDSLKKGLFAGERLLLDLRRMEAAYLERDLRELELSRHLSLREDHPAALQELLATGRCELEVTEGLLDGDFPGHYLRRIRSVSLTAAGAPSTLRNVNCTLTLLENRIRTGASASGSYAAPEDGDDPRFLVNLVPVQAVATSRPAGDAGVFELRFDGDRYLPFEGAGAVSRWRIELRQADNGLDLARLDDLVLTLAYTARSGGAPLEAAARAARQKALAQAALRPGLGHLVSLRRDLPEVWKRLAEAPAGQDQEIALSLGMERLPARLRGLDVRIDRVVAYAHPTGRTGAEALRVKLEPPKGSGAAVSGWGAPWQGSRALRATAEVAGAPGTWKLSLGSAGERIPELLEDLALLFELRARAV